MHATILACATSAATYQKPSVQQQSSGFMHKGRRTKESHSKDLHAGNAWVKLYIYKL